MCGVVGFSGKGGSRAQFVALCKQSCIRGIHAFGAAWIDTGGRLRYVRSVSYAAVVDAIPDPLPDRIMFHNRYCTSGDYLVPENNQPIVYADKGVALVFNGTVDMGTKEEMEERSGYSLLTENDGELVLLDALAGDPFRRIGRETGASFAGIVLGVQADGSPYIGPVSYHGVVHSDRGDLFVSGLNGTRSADSVMLYNHYYGASTGTNNSGTEYVVKDDKIIAINKGNSPLRKDETVVSVTGEGQRILNGLKVGDTLQIEQSLNEPWNSATDILGVGPLLVKDGQVDITSAQEQIGVDVTGAKAPRTAVGILKNGNVMFAVLDGRQSHSKGMMLDEFARFLIGMEVVDAVNFDGGGSSELVIGGKIVKSPSDGRQRPVATALTAVRR